MDIKPFKQIANPYYPLTSNIDKKEFVGRIDQLDLLKRELFNYEKTSHFRNIIITGEKSVGKSSLLKRFKDILQDHSFAIFDVELTRDETIVIDEFEFIKEIIDDLFTRYGSPDGEFFDPYQTEIWFSLTSGDYKHPSDFKERKLHFATKYSNKKKNLNEQLNYKLIESDFRIILDEITSPKIDFKGLAIIIDEFQQLASNIFLLDTLRKLSENLTGLIIIGAGIPSFLNNSNFEKFIRSSLPITLKNLSEKESLDLILNPIQFKLNCTRYDAEKLFQQDTLREILDRTNGNPLHIKIICANLFDEFQNDKNLETMTLSRKVMDKVMEYYSNISDKSRLIKNSLETCSKEHLKIFSNLYYYEGFNLKAIILSELAFDSIQSSEINRIKKKKLEELNEIFDLGLFEFTNPNIVLDTLEKYTLNELAQVSYRFIGDAIDKMYSSYLFEDLTRKELSTLENKDFDELLLLKLSKELSNSILSEKIINYSDFYPPLTKLQKENVDEFNDISHIINNFEKLKEYNLEKINSNNEITKFIFDISNKLDLMFPAMLLSIFEFEGYLLLISNVSIRGKKTLIYNYFPTKGDLTTLIESRGKILNYKDVISAALEEYAIEINWLYLYWIPKHPILLVYNVELGAVEKKLHNLVKERKFDDAVKLAEFIFKQSLRFQKETISTNVEDFNNYGFCLINVFNFDEAEKIFLELENKYLLSKINLSFLHFNSKNYASAKKKLKDIFKKKFGEIDSASFLHLSINHSKLSVQNIIAENVLISNVVKWNLALISAQEGDDKSIYNTYLKKVKIANNTNDDLYNSRVKYWIEYYNGNKSDALKSAKKLLTQCKTEDYIYLDILKDIEIISLEIPE